MGILKKIRWAYLLVSLVPVILGVICIAFPGFIAGIICYVAGSILMVYGLVKIIRYFVAKSSVVDSLIVGVLFSMIGFILVFRRDELINLIFIFIGILVILDGVIKLKKAFEARSQAARDWLVLLIWALVVLGFGILMVADPFTGYVPIIILGVAIVLDGLQNVYSALRTLFPASRPGTAPRASRNVTVEEFDVHEGE